MPQSDRNGEAQCVWIVKGSTKPKVLNASGYPAQIPEPRLPDLCEVRSTPDMGMGVFAKHDIERGEIILAERPLLVIPENIVGATPSEFESLLEAAVGRLSPESQADFKELQNSFSSDQCAGRPLLGIVKTNNYTIGNLFDGSNMSENYVIVNKVASRINHRCVSLAPFSPQ